ncbi:MAG: calcium/sodium antiporter [Longimicrobiales bacterium]
MTGLPPNILLLLGGFGALYFGAEWRVRGAARIASTMGISPVVVGLTLVSLGTSAPELVVCIIATTGGQGSLLIGNVLGSNLANIGLILGATALVTPLDVADRVITREVPIMILMTIIVYPLVLDLNVTRGEGGILLFLLAVYIAFTFSTEEDQVQDILDEVGGLTHEVPEEAQGKVNLKDVGLVVVGAVTLAVGGRAIVTGATFLAEAFGASELVIGLTVVALGTSLPELVTSLVAAMRKHADIAVGNIVGSNIFNLTAVLGGAATVREFTIQESALSQELPAVLALSVLVWPILTTARKVRRWEGAVLLISYFALALLITFSA